VTQRERALLVLMEGVSRVPMVYLPEGARVDYARMLTMVAARDPSLNEYALVRWKHECLHGYVPRLRQRRLEQHLASRPAVP